MIEVIQVWSMTQNVGFNRLFRKIIKTLMSILFVSLLLYPCVVILRLVVALLYQSKNIKRRYKHYCCFCSSFFCFLFQEEEDFNQVNLVIPGSLLPLKNEVVNIFEKEKQKLFRKERFAKVFKNISISAIFLNRKNLKKLVVKTKIA